MMMKKLMAGVQKSINNEYQSDYLMTQALMALEASEWEKAAALCRIALKRCESIEQRLAFMLLEGLANGRDMAVTKEYIDKAYEI